MRLLFSLLNGQFVEACYNIYLTVFVDEWYKIKIAKEIQRFALADMDED